MRDKIFRHALPCALALLVVSSAATTARAADKDFDLAVDEIRRQYHAKSHGGLMAVFAGMCVKMAHPDGVKSLKIKVFEKGDRRGDGASLGEALRTRLSGGWTPAVRVHSRRDGNEAYVYTRSAGKEFEVLVVAMGDDGGAVVQAKVDANALFEMMDSQAKKGRDESAKGGGFSFSGGSTNGGSADDGSSFTFSGGGAHVSVSSTPDR